jgi:capsular exopolysaccharide synthesis family protein
MSLIFDALQRSEGERAGVDLSALSRATELLARVERQTRLDRETATRSALIDGLESSEQDAVFVPPTVAVAEEESDAGNAPSPGEKYQGWFTQLQTLEVAASAQARLVCLTDRESLAAEKFRFLGVRLRHLSRERKLKTVLITSTSPREGKSTVAANLACILARKKQQRTLLLDGDLRRPSLSQIFGLDRIPGVCELLQGERSLTTSIYRLEGPDIWLLPAGSAADNPLDLLQSWRLSSLMDQLAPMFDWIIVDSPPVLPLADTSVWSRVVDGILLVTRQGTTEKKQLQRGLETIEHKKLIGSLLNSSQNQAHGNYYYHYSSPAPSQPA